MISTETGPLLFFKQTRSLKKAKDADNDRKRIDESMVQFGIAEQGYTTDNEATMQKTLREDN